MYLQYFEWRDVVLRIECDEKAVLRLERCERAGAQNPCALTRRAAQELSEYFSGRRQEFDLPLAPQGSAFQKKVWNALLEIPYGQTTTYGEIANKFAKKRGLARMSAQAVGGAVGHNEISVIVPCHRVVGTNGSLTGYAGGIAKKTYLLKLEGGYQEDRFFVPRHSTAP